MSGSDLRQRLAAILAADAAGYSRLMSRDERTTVDALDAARQVFRTHIEGNRGRVIDMAGAGEQNVKNIARAVRCYRVQSAAAVSAVAHAAPAGASSPQPDVKDAVPAPPGPSLAVLPFQNDAGPDRIKDCLAKAGLP